MNRPEQDCLTCFSRRRLLVAGATGAAALALTGCTTYGDEPAAASSTGAAGGGGAPSNGGAAGAATPIATLADVPVGGAAIIGDSNVVLTQPEAGTIQAFSAICTHAGCSVNEITDGRIQCPCHGSAFNLDGSVANGPASKPLPAVRVTVDGEDITLAS